MFKFKVKLKKDKNGTETTEIEVVFDFPNLSISELSRKLSIPASQIVSIKKIN